MTNCLLAHDNTMINIVFIIKEYELNIHIIDNNTKYIEELKNNSSSSDSLAKDLSNMIFLNTKNTDNINTSLTLSKKLVKLLNGTISISYKKNIGNSYNIKIPTIVSLDKTTHDINILHLKNKKLNILIINSDNNITTNLKEIFETINDKYKSIINIITIENILNYEKIIQENDIDIIYVNMNMTELSGLEFAHTIRQTNNYNNTLIGLEDNIFIIDNTKTFNDYIELFDDIITKNCNIDIILSTIINYLKKNN